MIEKGGFEIENEYADRIVAPQVTKEETDEFEVSLRPKTLAEYIGQDKVKDNLSIYIQAAKKRGFLSPAHWRRRRRFCLLMNHSDTGIWVV